MTTTLRDRLRADLDRIAANYTAAEQRIRADKLLSDEGRRRQLAEAWLRATRGADEARERHATEAAEGIRRARARLFGDGLLRGDPAALLVARRDAADRAERAERPEDLQRLADRAMADDDDQQLRQALRVAWDRTSPMTSGWRAPVEKILSARPDLRSLADDLLVAQAEAKQDNTAVIAAGLALSKPAELRSIDPASWLAAKAAADGGDGQ